MYFLQTQQYAIDIKGHVNWNQGIVHKQLKFNGVHILFIKTINKPKNYFKCKKVINSGSHFQNIRIYLTRRNLKIIREEPEKRKKGLWLIDNEVKGFLNIPTRITKVEKVVSSLLFFFCLRDNIKKNLIIKRKCKTK